MAPTGGLRRILAPRRAPTPPAMARHFDDLRLAAEADELDRFFGRVPVNGIFDDVDVPAVRGLDDIVAEQQAAIGGPRSWAEQAAQREMFFPAQAEEPFADLLRRGERTRALVNSRLDRMTPEQRASSLAEVGRQYDARPRAVTPGMSAADKALIAATAAGVAGSGLELVLPESEPQEVDYGFESPEIVVEDDASDEVMQAIAAKAYADARREGLAQAAQNWRDTTPYRRDALMSAPVNGLMAGEEIIAMGPALSDDISGWPQDDILMDQDDRLMREITNERQDDLDMASVADIALPLSMPAAMPLMDMPSAADTPVGEYMTPRDRQYMADPPPPPAPPGPRLTGPQQRTAEVFVRAGIPPERAILIATGRASLSQAEERAVIRSRR